MDVQKAVFLINIHGHCPRLKRQGIGQKGQSCIGFQAGLNLHDPRFNRQIRVNHPIRAVNIGFYAFPDKQGYIVEKPQISIDALRNWRPFLKYITGRKRNKDTNKNTDNALISTLLDLYSPVI